MEDNAKLVNSLIEKATEYGKTSFELIKLKAVDKISDSASSLIPHSVVFILLAIFMFFLNLGLAFWLGDLLGKTYLGFIVVGAFYGTIGVIMHFLIHKWLKKSIYIYFINYLLK